MLHSSGGERPHLLRMVGVLTAPMNKHHCVLRAHSNFHLFLPLVSDFEKECGKFLTIEFVRKPISRSRWFCCCVELLLLSTTKICCFSDQLVQYWKCHWNCLVPGKVVQMSTICRTQRFYPQFTLVRCYCQSYHCEIRRTLSRPILTEVRIDHWRL